jgi:hypothetical protein
MLEVKIRGGQLPCVVNRMRISEVLDLRPLPESLFGHWKPGLEHE